MLSVFQTYPLLDFPNRTSNEQQKTLLFTVTTLSEEIVALNLGKFQTISEENVKCISVVRKRLFGLSCVLHKTFLSMTFFHKGTTCF